MSFSEGQRGGIVDRTVRCKPLKFSRPAHRELRRRVFYRDQFTCQSCGQTPVSVPLNYRGDPGCVELWCLQVDHIIPRSHGGNNSFENLQTLCIECNQYKHTCLDWGEDE